VRRAPERPEEIAARTIVAATLGVEVSQHDDGSRDGMVDYFIARPGGAAPLEVIFDRHEAAGAQHTALRKVGSVLHIPGLRSAWGLFLHVGAHVRRLDNFLRTAAWEPSDEETAPPYRSHDVAADLQSLGVTALFFLPGAEPGTVTLHPAMTGSELSDAALPTWVGQVLAEQPDVSTKLLRVEAEQRHVFIWVTGSSGLAVQSQLEDREGQCLPTEPPALPVGVTHVWVAGTLSSQGCLAWSPDRGWSRIHTDFKNSAWPGPPPDDVARRPDAD